MTSGKMSINKVTVLELGMERVEVVVAAKVCFPPAVVVLVSRQH